MIGLDLLEGHPERTGTDIANVVLGIRFDFH